MSPHAKPQSFSCLSERSNPAAWLSLCYKQQTNTVYGSDYSLFSKFFHRGTDFM